MLGTWCIGNTTVRNPYRLKGGLIAIANSPLQGNMRRQKGDKALCELLGDAGLVSYREDMPDGTFSAGRKWRSALETMGFLFPKAPNGVDQMDIGPLDFITPNGMRLVDSNSVPGEQECFFRALAGQAKTVKTLSGAKCTFNPLLHVLTIMRGIELRTGDPSISAIELAICVFSTAPSEPYSEIIESLLDLRERRAASSRKKRI